MFVSESYVFYLSRKLKVLENDVVLKKCLLVCEGFKGSMSLDTYVTKINMKGLCF